MIAVLLDGVIEALSKTASVVKLHKLMAFAAEGRHTVITTSKEEYDNWLNSLDEPTRNAYINALNLSARAVATLASSTATVKISNNPMTVWSPATSTLGIDDALLLLQEPLGILLENANNDWHFLRRIVKSSERDRLHRAIEARWAEPLHGGGSDLLQRLDERARYEYKKIRTFVLFDSDRRHPDELKSAWAPTPPEACQGFTTEKKVSRAEIGGHWRLDRRFIESYMPKAEMTKVPALKPEIIEAFFRLPPAGQWHFNIKKGFSDDAKPQNAHRAKNLYDKVSEEDKALLSGGLGKNVADRYSTSETSEFDWDTEARREALQAVPNLMRLL